MRSAGAGVVAVVLLGILGAPEQSRAQAVGFNPTVGSLPDGVGLSVTPAVSADRRYVRLSVNPFFQTIQGFQTFPVPAAVSGGGGGRGLGALSGLGGGLGGGGGAGGGGAVGGGGGIGVVSGMNGPIGQGGLASSMGQAGSGYEDPGFGGFFGEDYGAWRPAPRRAKVTRPRTTRAKAAPAPAPTASKKKP